MNKAELGFVSSIFIYLLTCLPAGKTGIGRIHLIDIY